jgi:hypothetical protein
LEGKDEKVCREGKEKFKRRAKRQKKKLNAIREVISRRKAGLLRENDISEIDFALQVSQLQEQITGLIELMTMAKLALVRLLTDDDDTVSVDYTRPEGE